MIVRPETAPDEIADPVPALRETSDQEIRPRDARPQPSGEGGNVTRFSRRHPQADTARLILFNKPFGVLSQFSGGTSPDGADTLAAYIECPGVYPAGRLDKDSEGLLMLTDDGRLQARIADPRFKLPKTYLVQVEGAPDARALEALRRGVTLKDGVTRPAQTEQIAAPDLWPRDPPVRFRKTVPDRWLRITLREGRNRQVRRMTAAVGHPTLRLVRWRVGPWTVDGLAPGAWREALVGDTGTDPVGMAAIDNSSGNRST